MRVKIAARQSDLARLQAYAVGDALVDRNPGLQVEYFFKPSAGDLNLDVPLAAMGGKGVFTEDFYQDLCSGQFDMVVHSWKDLPVDPRPGTQIAATLPRADLRDLLLVTHAGWQRALASGVLRVLTSSPRRLYNLKEFLARALPQPAPQLQFVNVRGNIPTRMSKLKAGHDGDALVLAKAAMDRLLASEREEFAQARNLLQSVLQDCRWMVLPISVNPCAPAQGALAVEIAEKRSDLRQLLQSIHCAQTAESAERERAVLKSYGGGCHQKIGVSCLPRSFGAVFALRGETEQGETLRQWRLDAHRPRFSYKIPTSELFPKPGEKAAWYERRALAKEHWLTRLQTAEAVWVARANALPSGHKLSERQILWCAGVQSWRALASRGYWVNGTADGLGESEDPRIDILIGHTPAWLYLTHKQAATGNAAALPTYELIDTPSLPQIQDRKYFFWMSGSGFARALERWPEVRLAHHACGPGKTLQTLRKHLGSQVNIEIFLSYESWLEHHGIRVERSLPPT